MSVLTRFSDSHLIFTNCSLLFFLKQDKYKNEPPNAIDLFKVLHCSSKTGFTEHVKEVIVSSCSVLFPFLVMHLINLACTLAYVFSCWWIHGCQLNPNMFCIILDVLKFWRQLLELQTGNFFVSYKFNKHASNRCQSPLFPQTET